MIVVKNFKSGYHWDIANAPLHYELIRRGFDYLFILKLSVPSVDQPGHGGCLYTAIMIWMWDSRAVDYINEVYLEMGFKLLTKISDTQTRILFCIFSYSFLLGDICYDIFQEVFQRIDNAPDDVVFDNEMINKKNSL